MNHADLTLVFDGAAFENGEIDVENLGPALIALGNLIQSANEELNKKRAQVSVRVKATAAGSFEVGIGTAKYLMDKALPLLDSIPVDGDQVVIIASVLAIIESLIRLYKFLKGKSPERVEQKGDRHLHIHLDGNTQVIDPRALQLFESIPVRKNTKSLVDVLLTDGIDSLRFKRAGQKAVEIFKSEVGYFDVEGPELEIKELTRPMQLQIISLSFKKDNKWRVTDGSEPFNATIEDAEFLNRIATNVELFAMGDHLQCVVRERQFQSNAGVRKEYSIIEVQQHHPATQHPRLL